MLANRLKMTKRIMDGKSVLAYELQDCNGEKFRLTKRETEVLALKGLIDNVTAQRCHDKIIIKGKNGFKIKDIDFEDAGRSGRKSIDTRPILVDRVKLEGQRQIIGSHLRYIDGSLELRSSKDIIDMAVANGIQNVRINKSGDKYILRGTGCNLSELPVLSMTTEQVNRQIRKIRRGAISR